MDGQKETTYTKLNQSRGINCLYEFANPSDPKKKTLLGAVSNSCGSVERIHCFRVDREQEIKSGFKNIRIDVKSVWTVRKCKCIRYVKHLSSRKKDKQTRLRQIDLKGSLKA